MRRRRVPEESQSRLVASTRTFHSRMAFRVEMICRREAWRDEPSTTIDETPRTAWRLGVSVRAAAGAPPLWRATGDCVGCRRSHRHAKLRGRRGSCSPEVCDTTRACRPQSGSVRTCGRCGDETAADAAGVRELRRCGFAAKRLEDGYPRVETSRPAHHGRIRS